MYQEFFARSEMLVWPLVGLMIFVSIFAGVLAYVFFGLRDKDKVAEIAALPLAQDTIEEGHTHGRASR